MSEVKLLPLPEKSEIDRHLPTGVRVYGYTADDMKTYARANMEPLIAENERLRAKYQRAAESSEHFAARAERLAEALRDALEYLKHHLPDDMLEMHRAALGQEGGNG